MPSHNHKLSIASRPAYKNGNVAVGSLARKRYAARTMKTQMLILASILTTVMATESCGHEDSDAAALSGTALVAFVEAKSDHGKSAGNFGDIVILDLQTKKRFYVTDDNFYDSGPTWSPDGHKIAFLSNRTGSSRSLAIKGVSGPHQLCIYDLDQRQLSIAEIKDARFKDGVDAKPAWTPDGKGVFLAYDQTIFRLDLTSQTVSMVGKINAASNITALNLSPSGKYVGVHFLDTIKVMRFEEHSWFGLYDLSNSQFTVLPRTAYSWDTEWFPSGDSVLFFGPQDTTERHIYQIWNPRANRISPFHLPTSLPKRPSSPRVCPSGQLIGLLQMENLEPKGNLAKYRMFALDPQTQRLEWLTSGKEIDDITVCLVARKQ